MKNNDLAYFGGKSAVDTDHTLPAWPEITRDLERVVMEQLHTSISIYDRSGIIEEFENEFASLHGKQFALLNNSGTNSIWAMFVGANLQPGDEVLCPTYTFFATNTPMLSSGLVPVFCDAGPDGNIDPTDIEKRITAKTKAIIVTHMWGYPCDMDPIVETAKKHGLLLFEDCSHAHLATYKGKTVGSFGTAAAWSLQGPKNITGGEGGILVTDDQELYIRANLLGHYNKRTRQIIPKDHPLYKFAVTGMGLKHRSHPLAVVMMRQLLKQAKDHKAHRDQAATRYDALFAQYDFIELVPHANTQPSWYGYNVKYRHPHLDRETFTEMLHKEGLVEVDIPGSTGPNHLLPLFNEPSVLFPQFYAKGCAFNVSDSFPGALDFYNSIIKFPVPATQAGLQLFDDYLVGLKKVLDYAQSRRNG